MFSSLLISLLLTTHPHFVSVTNMNYQDSDNVIQISSKFFADDLERAISFNNSKKINLSDSSNYEENIHLLEQYYKKHCQIHNNGQALHLTGLGFEWEDESIWIYFETEIKQKPQNIQIQFDPLTEIISTQVNILHFFSEGQKKSTQLTKQKNKVHWSLSK